MYHLKNTCGKLKCARRIFERTACDQCGSPAFNGGRNIWLVHGRYHLELRGLRALNVEVDEMEKVN